MNVRIVFTWSAICRQCALDNQELVSSHTLDRAYLQVGRSASSARFTRGGQGIGMTGRTSSVDKIGWKIEYDGGRPAWKVLYSFLIQISHTVPRSRKPGILLLKGWILFAYGE